MLSIIKGLSILKQKIYIPVFRKLLIRCSFLLVTCASITSCEKVMEIPEPHNTVTTKDAFKNDKTAESTILGVYSQLANGTSTAMFTGGLITTLAMQSADELTTPVFSHLASNKLEVSFAELTNIREIWKSAYSVGIFGCNSVLEGVSASKTLSASMASLLEGEAKFIRAFTYFYLTAFFGEVPLVLETDFNKSGFQPKASVASIYEQILADLKDAQALLPANYSINSGQRIRANKWAATSMLARVYLYMGEYKNAAIEADKVIKESNLFWLMPNLNDVFLTTSNEAIWQLQHNNTNSTGNATPEGASFTSMFVFPNAAVSSFDKVLTPYLMNAFEPSDKRRSEWTFYIRLNNDTAYLPFKYKVGSHNRVPGGLITEYYTPLRLAEQYLIRAEAGFKGGIRAKEEAIEDLNKVRRRAGLADLDSDLSNDALDAAMEKEWQLEYFAEWGHRWLNLKRTGRASTVLSAIPYKQPWDGDRQLFYPVPLNELLLNPSLTQYEPYN